jgi:hypothetical protein
MRHGFPYDECPVENMPAEKRLPNKQSMRPSKDRQPFLWERVIRYKKLKNLQIIKYYVGNFKINLFRNLKK